MTNSHLPNSHPDVTPDWQDIGYTRTSFDKAIALKPIDGQRGHFSGFAPKDWCIPHDGGHYLHGGYIAALLIAGSRTYFRAYHGDLNQPDPIQMNLRYLQLTPPGVFHVHFTDIKLSQRLSTIQAELVSSDLVSHVTHSLALFTMGDLNNNSGICMKLSPIPIPDRQHDCARWTNAFFYHIQPPTSTIRYYNPKDGDNLMWSPSLGRNARDQWGKLDSGDYFRLEHLGLMADLIPAIHMNYQESGMKAVLKYEYPTISMDFDFRADPAGRKEWILNRTKMHKLQNGRFDMHVQMIDDDGDLIATVRHSCLVFQHKRGKNGKSKSSL